ncbi:ChrR family anti-sigma-E factor [Azospirillum agricola]|uniref:ChrR family anti-sigma-E factor n=1 Tax=Azospirillum agricola TaxID=1720247 RepID=UPI000A0F166E|nr:ChrR family anti-sigma-E factor [Azospirillum agricola]SMH57815.1 anti-ECFsigma factor, ChrR [Azospirillum lipoferum]
MSLPSHHPGDTLLIDYAGGALCEGASLVVATHMAFCPCCRRMVGEMEAVGGALLDDLEPDTVSPDCLDALLARIDRDTSQRPPPCRPALQPPPHHPTAVRPTIPEPLRGYLGGGLEGKRWRFLQPGMTVIDLRTGSSAVTRLVRMKGGVAVPQHTHGDIELTVVLEGGFSDELGSFQPGDIAIGDPSIEHRPVADPEGCLCLSATIGGLRLTGPIGRILNRFMDF